MDRKHSNFKEIKVIILGIVIIALSQTISGLVYLLPLPDSLEAVIVGVLYVIIAFNLIRLCCVKFLNKSLEEYYITKPVLRIRWLIVGIMLPTLVTIILISLPAEFVRNDIDNLGIFNIVISALFIVGFGAGVVEEMIFRGLIMKTIEGRWGKIVAIVVPSILFGLLHIIGLKMNIIDVMLLLIAGTSVGIMFSLIVYESGSIWSSAIVHGIWNVIMIGDIIDISTEYNSNSIFSYKLKSEAFIITGGEFGVESSIVAVLGYIIVIIITLYFIRRKSKMNIISEI